jgi:hypothetical protein
MTSAARHELASATRIMGAMVGCMRRQAHCPALVTRANKRTWRWLCMPSF